MDRPLRKVAVALVTTAGVHRKVAVVVQRGIEMCGVPTVLITVAPEESRMMRPPRAICPVGFTLGHSRGHLTSLRSSAVC